MYELIILGGGPAGLAAALGAYQNGLRKILIIERDKELGGILNQCIQRLWPAYLPGRADGAGVCLAVY